MAFLFDATPGGLTSNSFVDVAYADDYFGGSLYSAAWPTTSLGADLLTKQRALVSATRHLNRLEWKGFRTSYLTQLLSHPRLDLVDRDGNYLDSTTICRDLGDATCELAHFILQTDPDTVVDESLKQFKRLKIAGVIELEMKEGPAAENALPARVLELIGLYLTAGSGTRVVRA